MTIKSKTASEIVFIDGERYNVLADYEHGMWTGYVVKDGEFFCLIPATYTRLEIYTLAEVRIRQVLNARSL